MVSWSTADGSTWVETVVADPYPWPLDPIPLAAGGEEVLIVLADTPVLSYPGQTDLWFTMDGEVWGGNRDLEPFGGQEGMRVAFVANGFAAVTARPEDGTATVWRSDDGLSWDLASVDPAASVGFDDWAIVGDSDKKPV